MAKSSTTPTTATLMRFHIRPDRLPSGLKIWTLDFPFDAVLQDYKEKVQTRLSKEARKQIAIPYRQLNNALMAICPTLTHAFEYSGKGQPRYALAIGTAASPAEYLPDPKDILHIIRVWSQEWSTSSYIVKEIPEDEQKTLRAGLLQAINHPSDDWRWQEVPTNILLGKFDASRSLNYSAIPSLVAALLHDKMSIIHGQPVRWRKVQDSGSKKLSIVSSPPIWTSYEISDYQISKRGEGYFSYKLEFNLETQAGRDEPWLFISLRAQRYGHEALTNDNDRRRVAVLFGTNSIRLDDFPVDSTLVKLQISGGLQQPEWDGHFTELLAKVGAFGLEQPTHIFTNPRNHWRPAGAGSEYTADEYYIVHAEGYGYGDDGTGHALETGFSMTDSSAIFEAILAELPLLESDHTLCPDDVTVLSGKRMPLALRTYRNWSDQPTLKPNFPGTEAERKEERAIRYAQQRTEYQAVLEQALNRALSNEKMFIGILWHNEDTREGIFRALREAFLLNPDDDFPPNVEIGNYFVEKALLQKLQLGKEKKYVDAHKELAAKWQQFLQASLPDARYRFAIIEMLDDNWGVKGATREACAKENIVSQMVKTIRMKTNDDGSRSYLRGKGQHEHRANSVACEVTLRHPGVLYDQPNAIYRAAGIDDDLDVIAFYLERTQTNLKFPVAAKLTTEGLIEILLPGQNDWRTYAEAAPLTGQIFANEWKNMTFSNRKWQIRDDKRTASSLWYDKAELSHFVLGVLKRLERPTIALIDASTWRDKDTWPQLRNPDLPANLNVLNFEPTERIYQRDNPQFNNLLGVIRIRAGNETPQYRTDTHRDFTKLTGLVENSPSLPMHYYSIGRQLVTAKSQRLAKMRHATMVDTVGGGVAYKYPQVVELVPFFVREDYQTQKGLKQLCRVPHFLRVAPAWAHGNIVYPYPLHLARQLVKDQLCILAMEG